MMPANICVHDGWRGMFTTDHAPDCIPNGRRVVKVVDEPGDAHRVGQEATVLGSISHPRIGVAYFVEWDDEPRTAVAVVAAKIREI